MIKTWTANLSTLKPMAIRHQASVVRTQVEVKAHKP